MDRSAAMNRNFEAELSGELESESELEQEFESMHEFEGESELESELESEGESEHEHGEQFLGSIVSGLGNLLGGLGESELESEFEHEHEFENEHEHEFEHEHEHEQGEQFFGKILRRALPLLKRVAKIAAPIVGKVVAGAIPGPFGALAGQGVQALSGLIREHELESHEFEQEHEHELEHELESHEVSHELGEHEMMAEAMAHFAAQAEHELEAEAMVGAATTITLSARDRRALRRMIPHLVRGAAILTRILRMQRATRPMVRLVPTIIRRTAKTLRRNAASGQPITRQRAGAVMARQTRRVLSSPRYCTAALRRNVRAARVAVRPGGGGRKLGAV